jgi:hypothetical protein
MKRRRNKPAYDWQGISQGWMKKELKSGHWWDQFVRGSTAIPLLPRTTTKAEWKAHSEAYRKLERLKSWPGSRAFKQWSGKTSVCPKCNREVSNREYWTGKQGSTHFRGECKPEQFYLQAIPVQSWKRKLPYPMPAMPNYSLSKYPQNMEEFYKFWGVQPIGGD